MSNVMEPTVPAVRAAAAETVAWLGTQIIDGVREMRDILDDDEGDLNGETFDRLNAVADRLVAYVHLRTVLSEVAP